MKTLWQPTLNSFQKHNSPYAVHGDFCRIFHEDMTGLYWLARLLTADPARAEQCFVAGFDDSVCSNRVFRKWARSWSKRNIIKNAIRMLQPTPEEASGMDSGRIPLQDAPELHASTAAVLALPPFERFIFVMSVLEGYSAPDCATLLNCTRQDVTAGRTRALQQLARAEADHKTAAGRNPQIFSSKESLPLDGVASAASYRNRNG